MIHTTSLIWEYIKGYEGLYKINRQGVIISLPKRGSKREFELRPWVGIYIHTALMKNNINKHYRVHRLVAQTFIPNPRGLRYVNHKNGNKHDNQVKNLEWCDASTNQLHAYATGLKKRGIGIDNPRAVLTEREVKFLRWLKHHCPSITGKKVAEFYKLSSGTIHDIWRFKNWKHI